MVRDIDQVPGPGLVRAGCQPDRRSQHDGRQADGRVVFGHRGFSLVFVAQDLDMGACGDGEEAQELARARRQQDKLLGVQPSRVAPERGVG
jgi:hypothetical protein